MTKSNNKKTNLTYSSLLIFVGLVVALLMLCGCGRRRVNREHSNKVSEEFEYLTRRIKVHCPGDRNLSRKEVEQDLDELEWLLENRYSYLRLKGVDYRAALDSIRSSLGNGISRGALAVQLMKFMALFGDGHSRIGNPVLKWMCFGNLPFLIQESGRRQIAFQADRSDFIDPNFPFLRALDGVPIDSWLQAAGQLVAQGSPQYLRYHSIRNLRYIEFLRKELGLTDSGPIEVELESADGARTARIELPPEKKGPAYGFWPRPEAQIRSREDIRVESRILPWNIGYLRIIACLAEPKFLDDLVEAMNQFNDTDGLIIDIRSNGGGSRAPLRVLFPFFMAENETPRIVNVAAYRLGVDDRKEAFESRYLHAPSWQGWSDAEQAAIKRFAAPFRPEWIPPAEAFSQWHYFVISPSTDKRYYQYDEPVVILMDTWNFSACDIFLAAFKGWKNITLMGQPSGGGSGCRVRYRLHNSDISLYLSSMASFQPNGKLYDGNGIQPDVIIEPIPTDFIGKTDSILQTAIQRLQKKDG